MIALFRDSGNGVPRDPNPLARARVAANRQSLGKVLKKFELPADPAPSTGLTAEQKLHASLTSHPISGIRHRGKTPKRSWSP